MKGAILLSCLLAVLTAQAQTESFESSIPSTWATSGSNTLSQGNIHYKGGTQSLKWTAVPNQVLTVSGLNVSASVVGSIYSGTAHFWLYSEEVSADTLIVDFLDSLDDVKRTARVLTNFKGWRDFHRNYATDYGGGNALAGFILKKVRFTLKKMGTCNKIICLDEVKWSGDTEDRFPGPHMLLDADQFLKTEAFAGGEPLTSWLTVPDILVGGAFSLNTVRTRLNRTTPTVSTAEVDAAKAYVSYCNITDTGGFVKGRGLLNINNQDTLVKLAGYCSALGRAYNQNNDTVARTKLILFTKHLLDQGVAEGGRNVINTNVYLNAREFTDRFLYAMPAYPDSLKAEVIKMLKWSNEYNKIYSGSFIVRNNMDLLHTKIRHMFRLALLNSNDSVATRDLKCISRFLKRTLEPYDGARDGLKPDGLGFHHRSKYTHYMYAYATWIDAAEYLRGSGFKVSREAYDLILLALKAILLESNGGLVRSNATAGRFPFPDDLPFDAAKFRKLVTIGKNVNGEVDEPVAQSLYNYFYPTEIPYPGVPPVNLDGYHQFNYGQMGVQRRKNWVAVSRGLTNKMFGSEIYVTANRYGRYQSYGALEILYNDLPSTGYITGGAGWDWNVMPGTTTVHLSYDNLKPIRATATEYQGKSFAGALSAGNNGVFAIDFEQSPGLNYNPGNNLTFRKSVFAFDTVFVCLGTKINGTGGNVATNLFQGITTTGNLPVYMNSTTSTTTGTTLPTTQANWLVTAQTTGFYIPEENQQVQVVIGQQTPPVQSDTDGTVTASANASKAWINHGTSPNNAQYEYALVPGTNALKMQALADSIAQGKVYQVLAKKDDYHAVKYLPGNITGYAFFAAAANVNLGYVKSVTNHCIITTKEIGDTLVVRIANPDLNTVAGGILPGDWESTPSSVTVDLSQRWQLLSSSSSGTGNSVASAIQTTYTALNFVLNQGNYTEAKLVKDTMQLAYGTWTFPEETWNYDLSTATLNADTVFSSTGTLRSISDSTSFGFLPYPPTPSKARVSLGTTGNGSYHRISNGSNKKINIYANSSSLNKLSVYDIGNKNVTSMFFTLTFGSAGTNGNWILGIGDNATGTIFTDNAYLSSNTYTNGLFSALRFDLSSNVISFKYRKKNSTNAISFSEINQTTFTKGSAHFVEFYGNNDTASKSYQRLGTEYIVLPGTYHLWVNGNRITVQTNGFDIPATELVANAPIKAFFIGSTGNTTPTANSATLTVADMQARFPVTELALQRVVLNGAANPDKSVHLYWKTDIMQQANHFKILRYNGSDKLPQSIAIVKVNGQNYYEFDDKSLPANATKLFYKLELMDNGGLKKLTDSVEIALPKDGFSEKLRIFPNPADNKVVISCYASANYNAMVKLTSLYGKFALQVNRQLSTGHNKFELDVAKLRPGIYVLQVGKEVAKLIKN